MNRIWISAICWIVSSIFSFNAYSIVFYYFQFFFLGLSLFIVWKYRSELIVILQFRPKKDDYNESALDYYGRNHSKIFGLLLLIISMVYHTTDLIVRNKFDYLIQEKLSNNGMMNAQLGMHRIAKFHSSNGKIEIKLKVPVIGDYSQVMLLELNNHRGQWLEQID